MGEARHAAELAVLYARADMAMYEAKADIEWDMRWADKVGKSNVSTIVATTLSVPVIAWFLPPTHQYAVDALELIAKIDPNAPLYFLGSWGLLLAATFGVGQFKSLSMPGRLAGLVRAIGNAPSDVPPVSDLPESRS